MSNRPPSHDVIHAPSLARIGFEECAPPAGFCPLWRSYRGDGEATGSFHVLAPTDRWQIAIHDFMQKLMARPSWPARPVRPMRWT